ncbi:MAG: hypothetical protein M1818_004488 [Claussenomyces sp. TS43310]|nr:MAG: hypothetical protein M1818_004488 [Claussenomyces sp. TS43310]
MEFWTGIRPKSYGDAGPDIVRSSTDDLPGPKRLQHVTINGSTQDHRQDAVYTPWPVAEFHADTSFEINHETVSQYGLYDALSDAMKKFIDELHAVHTSRLQYDTILDLRGVEPNRPPIDTNHPAVRTHPSTGLKALNVDAGLVTGTSAPLNLPAAECLPLIDSQVSQS